MLIAFSATAFKLAPKASPCHIIPMREKELRLALICYGGVSLAVYMHGITREIWHLARASRAYHDGSGAALECSEAVYHQLLKDISAASGMKLRVLTDIIAGASAGGINGVFLAQAMATGQSLEPLTDLWLRNADVDTLLDPDARALSRFSKFWAAPIAWAILRRRGGAIARTVAADTRDEVATKLSNFVRGRWFQPPFGGREFSRLLLDALQSMEASPRGPSLLPDGQPLDLFVTVTDFHGHSEQLRLNSPQMVTENEHRITIGFSNRGADSTHIGHIAELAFAARATASFPGAFPPFSVRELDSLVQLRKLTWDSRSEFLQRILPQQFAAGHAEDTYLIDGSVLANAPFQQAIDALRNRPARREVDRRFVFIDPKPGLPSFRMKRSSNGGNGGKNEGVQPPGFFTTIFASTSDIPREQPIRDSLMMLETRSRRIRRLREVIVHLRDEVEAMIEAMLGKTWFLSRPTPARITKWRNMMRQKAADASGYSYPAYAHVRLTGILDDIVVTARRIWPDGPAQHFEAMREALWQEVMLRKLDRMTGDKGKIVSSPSIAFFRDCDLRFRVRRLRFLARRLAEEVEGNGDLENSAVNAMRDAIYASLASYLDMETAEFLGADCVEAVRGATVNPGRLIDMLITKRDLQNADSKADAALCAALVALPGDERRTMLLGYLGYTLYDIATLPLVQGEGLDEFDPVKVDRIAPDDAATIRKGGAAATLKGIEFNNFGAFFSRSYRENDYLWGRLHGVDRLIDIVVSAMPENSGTDGDTLSSTQILDLKKSAFLAILAAEEKRLKNISPLINELRAEIAAL